jgi:hypothetical protein
MAHLFRTKILKKDEALLFVQLERLSVSLAPNAKIRSQIVPKPEAVAESAAPADDRSDVAVSAKTPQRMSWAKLLARVFSIDMEHCPNCGSEAFRPIAAVMETRAVRQILGHLGLPDKPPDIAPARLSTQLSFS